jgi:hypothetical protein
LTTGTIAIQANDLVGRKLREADCRAALWSKRGH